MLSGFCILIGLFPVLSVPFLEKATSIWQGKTTFPVDSSVLTLKDLVPFFLLSRIMIFTVLTTILLIIVFSLYHRNNLKKAITWDCGYSKPSARMQYTSSSFAYTITDLFRRILKPLTHYPLISGNFPGDSSFASHVDDPVLERRLIPYFNFLRNRASWFYRFQQGQTQSYILYLVITLCLLLAVLIPFKQLFMALFTR